MAKKKNKRAKRKKSHAFSRIVAPEFIQEHPEFRAQWERFKNDAEAGVVATMIGNIFDEAADYVEGSEYPKSLVEGIVRWLDLSVAWQGLYDTNHFVATLEKVAAKRVNPTFADRFSVACTQYMVEHVKREAPGLRLPKGTSIDDEEILAMIDPKHCEKKTLDNYQQLLSFLFDSTRTHPTAKFEKLSRLGTAGAAEHKRLASFLYAKLRTARVFSFTGLQLREMYVAADRYTTEEIAGCDFEQGLGPGKVSNEEADHHRKTVTKAGDTWPFPEKLPFEICYLGFGDGMPLNESQAFLRMTADQMVRQISPPALVGYLLTSDGLCVEFLRTLERADDGEETVGYYFNPKHASRAFVQATLGFTPPEPEGRLTLTSWEASYDLSPWIVQGLIGSINWHNTLVVEGKNRLKRVVGPGKGGIRHIPPPYYVVTIRSQTVRDDVVNVWNAFKGKKKKELHYQHDRRAHYRLHVYRGKLPLSDKARKDFEQRKKKCKGDFQIWEARRPTEEVARCLAERGHAPKGSGEWMVTILTWIEDMLIPANPAPGIPYVPSIRKVPAVKRKAVG